MAAALDEMITGTCDSVVQSMMHVGDDDLFYAVVAASVCAYMLANIFSVLGYCYYFSLLPWRIGGFTFMRCKFTCVCLHVQLLYCCTVSLCAGF